MSHRHLHLAVFLLLALALVAGCGGGGGGGDADPAALPSGSWIAADPGPGFDYHRAMDSHPDGSTFVAGWFPQTHVWSLGEPGETTRSAVAQNDGYVSRYDDAGRLVWLQQIQGTDYVEPTEVVALPDGSCIVAGNTSGITVFAALQPEQVTLDTADVFFIARYLADGTLAWVRTATGSVDVRDSCLFPDGSVGVSGLMYGSVVFGPSEATETTLTATGGFADFVARYADTGSLQWAGSATGGSGGSIGLGVTALADGTAVAVGSFAGTVTFGPGTPGVRTFTAAGFDDGYIVRFSTTGSPQWARQINGGGRELPNDVVAQPNGEIALVASITEFRAVLNLGENDEQTVNGSIEGFTLLSRYSASGDVLWQTRIDMQGTAFLNLAGIASFPDSSIGVVGAGPGTVVVEPDGTDRTVLPAFDSSDLFLARYDAAGALIWARRDGGLGAIGRSEGMAAYPDGSMGFAGAYQGSFTVDHGGPGETTYAGDTGDDTIVLRYNADGSHDG